MSWCKSDVTRCGHKLRGSAVALLLKDYVLCDMIYTSLLSCQPISTAAYLTPAGPTVQRPACTPARPTTLRPDPSLLAYCTETSVPSSMFLLATRHTATKRKLWNSTKGCNKSVGEMALGRHCVRAQMITHALYYMLSSTCPDQSLDGLAMQVSTF